MGLTFGISYDPAKFVLSSWGKCGDFELAGPGWPGSGSGTSMLWNTAQTSNLVEAYWLQGYAYSYTAGDTTSLALIPHPDQGGYFVDDGKPGALDPIAAYGAIGFGTVGKLPCPADQGGGSGVQWIGQNGDQSENGGGTPPDSSGGGGGGGGEPDTLPNQTPELTVWINPDAISIDHNGATPVPIGQVQFLNQAIPTVLAQHGATTLSVEFPGSQGDTLEMGANGEQVRLPDISGFYLIRFPSALAASGAISDLMGAPGVRIAQRKVSEPLATDPCLSDDPYCYSYHLFQPCFKPAPVDQDTLDVQWDLFNSGVHGGNNNCGHAVAGVDARLPVNGGPRSWPSIPDDPNSPVALAEVDVGVTSHHPDLHVVDCYPEPCRLHPSNDYCGSHGTEMSGIMGAQTDNLIGIAGVCPNAQVLDVEAAENPCDGNRTHMGDWASMVEKARYDFWFFGWPLRVFNLPFGGPLDASPTPNWEDSLATTEDNVLTLWRSFKTNMVCVAAHGDSEVGRPQTVSPSDVPFVCGVGGFTQDGRYWCKNTNCLDSYGSCLRRSQHGTTPGFGLDICAPSCPGVVTSTIADTLGQPYYWTSMQNSGASSIVSGAVGLLYRTWRLWMHDNHQNAPEPRVDDYVGLITGTAIPWNTGNWHLPSTYAGCTTCTDDDFGHGRVNVYAACAVLDSIYSRTAHAYVMPVRVYGNGSGAVIDSSYFGRLNQFYYFGYRARVTVRIQESGFDPAAFPQWIAWPIRWTSFLSPNDTTNSCQIWGTAWHSGGLGEIVDLASDGVTGCDMGNIDQSTGLVTMTGYNLGQFNDDGNGKPGTLSKYFVPWSQFRMYYAVVTRNDPAGVSAPLVGRPGSSAWLTGFSNPTRLPAALRLHATRAGHVAISVEDVTGRQVTRLLDADIPAGARDLVWTGSESQRLAAGVYWIRLRFDRQESTRKMVVLR